ncbi:MAG: hypothetical protein JWP00_1578 [Chloroflexi bacterium]|jgi:hypothetical protein|nr:hypothetical protein [Chloroflexota bacterium]
MDGERLLINFGVIVGFLAITSFWIGLSMWMRVDADKRGLPGYLWIFVGLVTGPLGLIAYIIFRGNRPVLPIVHTRDALIAATSKTHQPADYTPENPEAAQSKTSPRQ